MTLTTSALGIDFLQRHEGVVLKAYRDPVGIWTIGAGLTKASGVIDPKPGMVITRQEAAQLLGKALGKYEARVRRAMPGATQQDFDGGVSFDFNTGKIHSASWVKGWLKRDWPDVRRRLAMWKKAKGRVLPGLVRRRQEEYQLMKSGDYGEVVSADMPDLEPAGVRIVLPINAEEKATLKTDLLSLGYQFTDEGVRKFQADHDLEVDGLVGRATLTTILRRKEAAEKTVQVGGAGGVGGAGVVVADVSGWVIAGGVGLVAVLGLYVAWRYRDVVAVKIQNKFPTAAAKLRGI